MRVTQFLAFTLVLASGCGHDCSAIGCPTGVTLEFASPLVEEGEYAFTVTSGTNTVTCSAFVPLRRDGSEPSCEGMSISRQEITTRTDDGVRGTAGDDVVSVWLQEYSEPMTLTVTRDGTEILRTDVTPTYRGVEINGDGCGECQVATQTVGG